MTLLSPPRALIELVEKLEGEGFETWCVGGAVRDALLGHPHLDWDLATAATPDQVQRIFRRTVPVGIRFGTVGVFDRDGRMHEVTTFREDVETDGRHAVVKFGVSLDEDLARRDLTINAIAYSPTHDRLHDPFDGRGDLSRRLIRAVGDPRERVREDLLRSLRAIRFAARLGFEIDDATWTAIVGSAPSLGRLAPERVRQELEKTMEQVGRPSEALARWNESGAMRALIPALAASDASLLGAIDCVGVPGPGRRAQRKNTRLAALFLAVPSAELTPTLRALRFSNGEVSWLADMIGRWQDWGAEIGAGLLGSTPIPASTVRRWASVIGRTRVAAFFRLASAVWSSRRGRGEAAPDPAAVRRVYRLIVLAAYRDPIELADLAVDGEELIGTGVPAGPMVGVVLRKLLSIVLENPAANTRDQLVAAARSMAEEGG